MLKYLKIKNLAVIDGAEIEAGPGFICLTGESGTGKSVLIEALLLLGGGRAATDLVRTGCDRAVVEAEFELAHTDSDLELLEDHQLFLRREIARDGKSRAFVNGVMVPSGLLQRYGRFAFEIHGQHGQQRLLKAANHLDIFDEQTGLKPKRARFEEKLNAFKTHLRDYGDSRDGEAQRLKEIDFLRVQIGEIEEARVSEEDRDLDFRIKKARNRELIRANRRELSELLNDRLVPDLTRSEKLLAELREFQSGLAPYLEQVSSLSITLADLRGETEYWDEGSEEESLQALEERESVLNRLFMKYGRDVDEVLAERERLEARLEELGHASASLAETWKTLTGEYTALCREKGRLHGARQKAVSAFAKTVKGHLVDLALKGAAFQVDNRWPDWKPTLPKDCRPDEVRLPGPELSFLFSSNPGEPVKPLARVASGGELSRVLLALINAFKRPSGRLLVFDEIDAGLGGETAHAVGARLASLGETHQVLCATHFAQVARCGNQHIKIEKMIRKGRTFTTLALCDHEARIAELARLMGGDSRSEKLLEHARALLEERHETASG